MNKLDLDISKYSDNELCEIFNISQPIRSSQVTGQIGNFKTNVLSDTNLGINDKDNIIKFLNNVIQRLSSLDKIVNPNSGGAQTFSSVVNDMIIDTPVNHPIIENPNALAGRNAKIYEGRNVNFNEYPPGYMNPINVKTIKKVLNIDSRFRSSYYSTLSTDYHIDIPETFRRVVNLRLTAFEIPLTTYAINSSNNCFMIDSSSVDISFGNYVTPSTAVNYQDASASIIPMINDAIAAVSSDISYNIDPISGKSVFKGGSGAVDIYFNTDCCGNFDLNTPLPLKLGWLLGFRAGRYALNAGGSVTSEGIATMASPKYIYICINDFTNAGNNSFVAAFADSTLSPYIIARIQYQDLIQGSGVYNFGQDNDTLDAVREYFGPVDIQKLHLQILDEYGRVVDFNNMDWSCSITFDILYD